MKRENEEFREKNRPEYYGSRYTKKTESVSGGSRYVKQTENTSGKSHYEKKRENATSASRYGQKGETVSSGSRYARQNPSGEYRHTSSRYADKRTAETAAAQEEKKWNSRKLADWLQSLRREKDPVKIAMLCLGGAVMAAYLIVGIYFGGHFYPGIRVYGIDCGKLTAAGVKQEVIRRIGEYTLMLEEREGKEDVITAAQIQLQYEDDNRIEALLKRQKSFLWPVMLLIRKNTELDINTRYDRDGIDAVIAKLGCMQPENIIPPQDAYRGETEKGYEVVSEVMGTTLDYDKTRAAILEGLDRGVMRLSLEDAGCYVNPVIYQDDTALNEEVQALNSLLTAHITYDFSDRQEVVDAGVIRDWIFKDDSGAYYIDDNHIWAYVEQLAEKYDTFGGNRTFYTSIGTTVDLYGGDYGWAIDQDATAEILAADVKAGKTETIEPQYTYSGMCREENDIGGTYVEVCISRQEMWCYQDGCLVVDTPVVTGNPNKNNGTPSGGVWAIDAKMQDYTLRGEGYAAPVAYWLPFNGNVGIHDLQTRYYFGGSIYLSNGSHGCVNTPYEAAQTIYSIVSIGTPVVVYE